MKRGIIIAVLIGLATGTGIYFMAPLPQEATAQSYYDRRDSERRNLERRYEERRKWKDRHWDRYNGCIDKRMSNARSDNAFAWLEGYCTREAHRRRTRRSECILKNMNKARSNSAFTWLENYCLKKARARAN